MKKLIILFIYIFSTPLFGQTWKVFEFSLFEGDYLGAEVIGNYQSTDYAINVKDDPSPRLHIRINKLNGDIGVVLGLEGLKEDFWFKDANCQLRFYGDQNYYNYVLKYIINDTKGLYWFQSPLNPDEEIRSDKYTMPLVYSLMKNKEVYLNVKINAYNIKCTFSLSGSSEAINKLLKYKSD